MSSSSRHAPSPSVAPIVTMCYRPQGRDGGCKPVVTPLFTRGDGWTVDYDFVLDPAAATSGA